MRLVTEKVAQEGKGSARPVRWAVFLVVGLGVMALLLGACSRSSYPQRVGPYPWDIFPEMHYSISQRSQEPPRLYPAVGAVPVQGAELLRYPTLEEYKDVGMPLQIQQAPNTVARGQALFQVNCSMCHGLQAKGDGKVKDFLVKVYGSPPDLTARQTAQRTDGEIFGVITNGVFVMPTFKNLLSEEERWQVVRYLRTLQEGR
ncbi:MAG: cytochrome c [Dehalococcoidia bacterium]|nr:cytochrome c [Dehalococcoidia bacterium]